MTDFGADESFAKASEKMKEHYGIEVPISAVRNVSQEHGGQMLANEEESELGKQGARLVIAGMDGSMIPIVSIKDKEKGRKIRDKRKCRELGWREARLCVARDPRSVSGHYRATLGDVQEAGKQLVGCVAEAGGGKTTKLHIVADGAPWIASQVDEQFGEQANFLIDFYHVSEYLAAASELLGENNKQGWFAKQQRRLKVNNTNDVLQDLVALEALEKANLTRAGKTTSATKEEQPASTCRRYIENRLQYLDYKRALNAGLPISSGETESGHRWIIQARLKISGAWWTIANAQRMLKLRTMRASREWESYWRSVSQAAA
jgi:Uncharacterised protein family (UPF0236)